MPTPKFLKYKKNSLRPNPFGADPERGEFAYAQGSSTEGDFGDRGAAVRPALGLPPETTVRAKGEPDETIRGFIPAPGVTPLQLGAQQPADRRPPRGRSK